MASRAHLPYSIVAEVLNAAIDAGVEWHGSDLPHRGSPPNGSDTNGRKRDTPSSTGNGTQSRPGELGPRMAEQRGISLQQASRDFEIPYGSLWRCVTEGLIPVLNEGKGRGSSTYVDYRAARDVASIYHRAKADGHKQPIKLIRQTLKASATVN